MILLEWRRSLVDSELRGLEEAWLEVEDRDWPIGLTIEIRLIFTLFEEDRLLIGTENLLAWIVTECVGGAEYLHN